MLRLTTEGHKASRGLSATAELLVYALPARGGFFCVEPCNKINALFRRLKRFGYFSHTITVSELLQNTDIDLFYKMLPKKHFLHYLLPPRRTCDSLRSRGHFFDCLFIEKHVTNVRAGKKTAAAVHTENLLSCVRYMIIRDY